MIAQYMDQSLEVQFIGVLNVFLCHHLKTHLRLLNSAAN